MTPSLSYPSPSSTPVRAKRFAELGWAGGRDDVSTQIVAVDVGTEATCVSTFPRGYENSTSILMPTALHAADAHAFRTLERKSFILGSSALSRWPSDRVLRGPHGSVRLSSQIGLVDFPADHVLAGLIVKGAEQHGRSAEQLVIVLSPFLTADRVEALRATVKTKTRLKLVGKPVSSFVSSAYFYLMPALKHGLDKQARTEMEKWSLGALGDGRIVILDWGAPALAYGVVDLNIKEKANELRLITAGAWPSLGGNTLTLSIFADLKRDLTDVLVRSGPAKLKRKLDADRAKDEIWKTDSYDDAFRILLQMVEAGTATGPRADELRNLIFPTIWTFPEGQEPAGYAPMRKIAIEHARRLWDQAETIKKTALADPQRYMKDPILWSVASLKSKFTEHLPEQITYKPSRFLTRVHADLTRFLEYLDDVLANLVVRRIPHIALSGMQSGSRLLPDTIAQFVSREKDAPRALSKADVAPIAETALELKSVPTRGAALLLRDEKEIEVAPISDMLPFHISICDTVGNIDIFRAGPIDELTFFQRRLHVDSGHPSFEFFVWQSEDGLRDGAWGAIDFNKPEEFTAADRTVRVDIDRFWFGKSGRELPRFRDFKEDASEFNKCFDRESRPPSYDGRISLRRWLPHDDTEAAKLILFLESDLVETFRKKVFLLEREIDAPPANPSYIYQRYYLSKAQELIVVREWWAPHDGKLRRHKTLHVCIGSTESERILGTEWGKQ